MDKTDKRRRAGIGGMGIRTGVVDLHEGDRVRIRIPGKPDIDRIVTKVRGAHQDADVGVCFIEVAPASLDACPTCGSPATCYIENGEKVWRQK